MTGRGYIATVGMFDGVHSGHAFLLKELTQKARALGLCTMALTFDAHPKSILTPNDAPLLLSTASQRREWIRAIGIDRVDTLHADKGCFGLSGREFLEMLRRDYGVAAFMMGFDNHIGHDRVTAEALTGACIPVYRAAKLPTGTVNSSMAREALSACRLDELKMMLGRPYTYRGSVVGGKKLGRTIGFPTANIAPAANGIMQPPPGVYAIEALLPDGSIRGGMANIGRRPTVDAAGAPISFEVHIFDYDGNLYGETIDIQFVSRLRDEQAFADIDALRRQLAADRDVAKKILARP